MEDLAGIIEQYQSQIQELEDKLLDLQQNPDSKLSNLREISESLRIDHINRLEEEEEAMEKRIISEKEHFNMMRKKRIADTEDMQNYIGHHAYGLKHSEERLKDKKKRHDMELKK